MPWQEQTVSLVWLVRNTTEDYAQLSAWLLENGIEGGDGRGIIAVDTAVLARDPWLRGAAAVLAVAAIVLALLPRACTLPHALPRGPGGSGIEVAQMVARFLRSLRNAYVALAAAGAVLGVPLVLALSLFADMAASGKALGQPREPSYFGWQATVFSLLLLAFAAGVLASCRPALETHLALRRWRRHESSPPVEGELGQ